MEIERKWLVKTLPDLSGLKAVSFERYFFFIGNDTEIRVQKRDIYYEFERKTETSAIGRAEIKFEIPEDEFEKFKLHSDKAIVRENYDLQTEPYISLKIYHGIYEGLIRVEVEFDAEEKAYSFEALDWFGTEITNTDLGRDKRLIKLSRDEFLTLHNKLRAEL